LLTARPLRPSGPVCPAAAGILGVFSVFFVVLAYPQFHRGAATILFANVDFARALTLVMALFIASALLRGGATLCDEERTAATVLALAGVLLLWILLTEEIWLHFARGQRAEWRLPAHMYISILWAVYATALMVVGFWRRVRPLRYIALGIFLLLLAKVFLVDTRTISTVYRIAGFLVTGLALVGVSYLYQYLRKQGFFEAIR
jgi:uncharacterized membrane protein